MLSFHNKQKGTKFFVTLCLPIYLKNKKNQNSLVKWNFIFLKSISDLTDFTVGAWEPSHDTELWKSRKRLHLFVQHAKQGDGERVVEFAPQPVYVLEVIR